MSENLREKIWLIADGIPLILANMTVKTSDSDKLLVIGWTGTIYFENINKKQILMEYSYSIEPLWRYHRNS